jgi:glycosyltransferase involved in cell wall biosynthesis
MRAEAHEAEHIIVTGEVEDARPYIARASVFAAPLRAGSGTKVKILEALALQRAVLTTPIGAEGLELTRGREVFIEDHPESFESSLMKLLSDPDLRRELGQRGRDWAERHASLEVLRTKIARLLEEV